MTTSHIFNKKAPIVVGMEIVAGTMRLGTPLCVTGKTFVGILNNVI